MLHHLAVLSCIIINQFQLLSHTERIIQPYSTTHSKPNIACLFLQRLPATRALHRFFPISNTKFWWTSIKCIHDNSRVHFVSVSRRCSIAVGSGKIAQLIYYDKVISCNFAEMEGYCVKKTWSVFESYKRNTFSEWNVCEEGGVSIVRKQN